MIYFNGRQLTAMLVAALLLALSTASTASSADKNSIYDDGHYVLVNGTKLHYVESGSGQPVVLLHGNAGSAQDFTMSIFDKLAPRYRTLAFDRPGHGRSENPPHTTATPEVQARILHDALQELKIARPILVAHSWSGSLALSYALQFPRSVSGMVLFGAMAYPPKTDLVKPIYKIGQIPGVTTMFGVSFKAFGRPIVERLLKQAFMPDPAPKEYVKTFLQSTCRISQLKAAARDELCVFPSLRKMSPKYETITVPTVIVTGDADRTVPPQNNSYHLHEAIPSSKLIVLHNAGHELQFTRPTELLKAIDLAVEMSRTVRLGTASQVSPSSEIASSAVRRN